ncbi:MAG TPA: Crp/Fnr family transcriptional regulator [Chitinophagales bacterium]|nr:Crp/Fnr family transcriptional regulator [Chitinophagales bacterium]HPN18129.1 Crp/Fnr family transcriptional regulator [Chitinophagales bacterium]
MSTNEYPTFINFLKQFGELPDIVVAAIDTKVQRMELPKKHILLKKGKVCNFLYFIEKGLARNFFEEDNKELTNDIILEGEILVSFSSFISRKPSLETIELLEDGVLCAIHYDNLQNLYQQFPIMERTGRMIAEHHYNSLAMKSYRLKFSNSSERYQYLFENKIEIVKRVPIGIIASYLGMSIETLSRIRGK